MQSKGKMIFLVVILVVAGGFFAALMHEPKLVQSPVEQRLDAGTFSQ